MKILVTGANGFIGSSICRILAKLHELTGVVRSIPADPADGVVYLEQDLARLADFSRLPETIDVVIHLAQSAHFRSFPEKAADIFAVNVESTFRLLEYARSAGARRFILASSGGVYGFGGQPFSEQTRLEPPGFYQGSKAASESLVQGYRTFFSTIILRPFFVYGPKQKGMLIPTLVEKVSAGRRIVIDGDPGLRINPLFIDDAIQAIVACLENNASGIINLAGDDEITITGLVELIAGQMGREAIIEYAPSPSDRTLLGDNSRMKLLLGVTPAVSIAEGIARIVQEHKTSPVC